MTKASFSALVLALAFSGASFAEEQNTASTDGKTTIKVEDAKDKKNSVDGNIDQEITNAKLRAESGSKSKYSLSFSGSYLGSSLQTPFGDDRPNTSNSATPPRVFMGGSFGGRYRMNKNESLSLGVGFGVIRPLSEAKYWDISNPYLSYSNVGNISGVQNIFDTSLTVTTDPDQLTIGDILSFGVGNTMMYDFGGSRGSIGLALTADYTYFNKKKDALVRFRGEDEDVVAGPRQVDYTLAAYPMAEYSLSDKLQLRTVFRPWIYKHNVLREGVTFSKDRWTQSIGVGYAMLRNVYLYPNFQFDWEQWRGNDFNLFSKGVRANSTVGLSATLNIF